MSTKIAIIIPALNEEQAIGGTIEELRKALSSAGHADLLFVVADNGSVDATAEVAEGVGAKVVYVERRGYGAACLGAMAVLPVDIDIILFADGDASDEPQDAPSLVDPIAKGEVELVIGSRILGMKRGWMDAGALTPPQRFGSFLATGLLSAGFDVSYTDLGPFRAISWEALQLLKMDDRNFGWTLQMQARAASLGLRSREVPVHYHCRRNGESKISGSIKGSFQAGFIILRTFYREYRLHRRR